MTATRVPAGVTGHEAVALRAHRQRKHMLYATGRPTVPFLREWAVAIRQLETEVPDQRSASFTTYMERQHSEWRDRRAEELSAAQSLVGALKPPTPKGAT